MIAAPSPDCQPRRIQMSRQQAVEVGARAAFVENFAPDPTPCEWDELTEADRNEYREAAAAVLEAVGYADKVAEVERLHITVREDKRVMDRDAAEIARLRAISGVPEDVRDAIADLAWKATQYGTTPDGDTAAYLIPKGTMHRLMHVMQNAGAPVAFRAALGLTVTDTPTEGGE